MTRLSALIGERRLTGSVQRVVFESQPVTVERLRSHGLGQWAWRRVQNETQLGIDVRHILRRLIERLQQPQYLT